MAKVILYTRLIWLTGCERSMARRVEDVVKPLIVFLGMTAGKKTIPHSADGTCRPDNVQESILLESGLSNIRAVAHTIVDGVEN